MKTSAKAILAILPFAAAGILPMAKVCAAAENAFEYHAGTSASSVTCTGATSVQLERQSLRFDVEAFPIPAEGSAQKNRARVTAEYEFYNPTEQDEEMAMLFPCGTLPAYAEGDFDCEITLDGAPVVASPRHSLDSGLAEGTYNVDQGAARLSADMRTDDFFSPFMPVTKYVIRTEAGEGEARDLKLSFALNPKKSRILAPDCHGGYIANGFSVVTFRAVEAPVVVYVVGESSAPTILSTLSAQKARTDTFSSDAVSVGYEAHQTVFAAFLESKRPANVNFIDWYNACLDFYNDAARDSGVYYNAVPGEGDLLLWYEYSVLVPAQERVTNVVSAPLYPEVKADTVTSCYYQFLLSPAQKWGVHKGLEITINTPFTVSSSSLDFERTENGYHFSRDSLPVGELTFTLADGEPPAIVQPTRGPVFSTMFGKTLLILTCVTALAVGATVAVVVCIRRLGRRNNDKPKQ